MVVQSTKSSNETSNEKKNRVNQGKYLVTGFSLREGEF